MNNLAQITPGQAREALWRSSRLRWKLDRCQQEMYDAFYNAPGRKIVINSARRLGKSWFLCVLAIEQCLKAPFAQVKFAAPTQRMCKRVIFPLFREILQDCPEDIKPEFFAQEQIFEFRNGSTISIASMDAGRSDALRGTSAALCIVDEAAFTTSQYLEDMVQNVMMPMLLLTGGKLIIASTPPKTPRHSFEAYFLEAQKTGAAIKKTIYDNARITPELIEEFKKEAGGEQTTTWLREYMCSFCVDEALVVFPEFDFVKRSEIIRINERPAFFDAYVSMDFGVKDGTAIIFYYWDFQAARMVVEDEIWLYGTKDIRTDIVANLIKEKERTLWGEKKPYYRVTDVELLLINDLHSLHGLQFYATKQESREAGINEMRMMIQQGKIIINPKCVNLIDQLQACIWNSKRDDFDRVKGYGHFDFCAALIYGLRAISRHHNPFPADRYSYDTQFFTDQPYAKTPNGQLLEMLFKTRKPR